MRYVFIFGSIIFSLSFPAVAENTNQNNYGLSFGSSNTLSIKKFLNQSTQILAGASLTKGQASSSNSCCSSSNSNYAISVGVRHYQSVAKLSPFGEATISWIYNKSSSNGLTASSSATSLNLSYGIEYFISTNLSIEGKAGVGLAHSSTSSSSGFSSSAISIPSVSTAVTYYW